MNVKQILLRKRIEIKLQKQHKMRRKREREKAKLKRISKNDFKESKRTTNSLSLLFFRLLTLWLLDFLTLMKRM